MPDLDFSVAGVNVAKHAAAPALKFELAIAQRGEPLPIQTVSLQCQIRIDTRKRTYRPEEQDSLSDLFGTPERWSKTLNSMLWTHASVTVPAFDAASTTIELPVPCSFDFNLAATKYFHGLQHGDVPLILLFSGSVFYRDAEGALSMDLVSWNKEAHFRLPIGMWQDMMEIYYPNSAFLCVNRKVFDALYEYKRRNGYTGFDEALTSLLPDSNKAVAS